MDTPFDSSLSDDIKKIVVDLPPQVRAFFASGKVETVAKSIMQKNQLRIDQGAVVEREIILLLLGLKTPDEFNRALVTEAKLNQQTIGNIVREVNEQIFVPIREQMRSESGKAGQPAKPPPPPQASTSGQTYAPPPQSPKYFHLENKIPAPPKAAQATVPVVPIQPPVRLASPTIAPLPPKVVLPASLGTAPTAPGERSALRDALASAMKNAPSQKAPAGPAKPMESRKLLEDHEEPHIEFRKAPPPPPNLPGAPRPSVAFGEGGIVHPPLPSQSPAASPPPPSRPLPPAPPISSKPRSADPYREPIDEK